MNYKTFGHLDSTSYFPFLEQDFLEQKENYN